MRILHQCNASPPLFFALLATAILLLLSGCTTTGGYGSLSKEEALRQIAARDAKIRAEPRGGYYIGRRYLVRKLRSWGYLRRPGEPWENARLVVFNERAKRAPDRLPEVGGGRIYGFDHNYEYKITGRFTGRDVYDPNANTEFPEFRLTSYTLIDTDPGYLFRPGEIYRPDRFPER